LPKKKLIHPRKLTIDPLRKPAVITNEYFVNGIFIFDITGLRQYIQSHLDEFLLVGIKVSTLYGFVNQSTKDDPLENMDKNEYCILAEISPDRLEEHLACASDDYPRRGYNVIYGQRFLEYAHRNNIPTVRAFIVRMEQHLPFLVKGYEQYIGYWNDKLQNYQKDRDGLVCEENPKIARQN
jgi:hypothetical protein